MSQYVVTAQKPSNVNLCVIGNFTSPTELNLIVANCSRLEIYSQIADVLHKVLETPVYGRIANLELYRRNGCDKDLLFLTTERRKFCVLEYDGASGELLTRAKSEDSELDRIGKTADFVQIAHIDPERRMIGLRINERFFKVIPIDANGDLEKAFNIGMADLHVIDFQFLHGCAVPTILLLYEDPEEMRHLKTYRISIQDKELQPGPWQQTGVEMGATWIIPVPMPLGGAILVGKQTLTYLNGDKGITITIPMPPAVIRSWGKIDKDRSRYLLGDQFGRLYILMLENDGSKVLGLKLDMLGETSCAHCIAYLDSDVVFIGSCSGDSQLIRLHPQKDDNGSNIEVLETFTNLGPIQDFCVVDLKRQGRGQVITCSGRLKDGSLRIVPNGIGIHEHVSEELSGIKGLWTLREIFEDTFDKYLVYSFIEETRVLEITGEVLVETEIDGFDHTLQTLFCGNIIGDGLVQVTEKEVRLVSASMKTLIKVWKPSNGERITVAAGNAEQLVIAIRTLLVHLNVSGGDLVEVKTVAAREEVSCITLQPWVGDGTRANLVAVGTWDNSIMIHVLRLPELEEVACESLGGGMIPRSLLLTTLEGVDYLLCALGDGFLCSFHVEKRTGALSDLKKVSLGTAQPMTLNKFTSKGSEHVFAASDRPTVIYSKNRTLLSSNVKFKEVTQMCSFNSEGFPDSMAIATQSGLSIGTIDDFHIRTVRLDEEPYRIAHQLSSRTLCVCTIRTWFDDTGAQGEDHVVKLMDDQTFEVLGSCELNQHENARSAISTSFADEQGSFFVVGTGIVIPGELESMKGRIHVFAVVGRTLQIVTQKEVTGAVNALNGFNGRLLAGINAKIELFVLEGVQGLISQCSHYGHILVHHLQSHGNFIVAGDSERSISLLAYQQAEGKIEEIARDHNSNSMMALEIVDEDTYIGAEARSNLFTVRKNRDGGRVSSRLEAVGEYHLGDMVHRFRACSLVKRGGNSDGQTVPAILFGTENGSIGVVASLGTEEYETMLKVQTALNQVIKGVGELSHNEWRAFQNESLTRARESKGFLDGDLIESFLDLKLDKMEEVARSVGISVGDICRRVQDLQYLHSPPRRLR